MVASFSIRARGFALSTLTGAVALLTVDAAAAAETFTVRLTTVPIDSATRATTTGNGTASAILDGTTLTIEGSFAGLAGPATIARLHRGSATGVRGPSFAELTVPQATSGTFRAKLTLASRQTDELRGGRIYLQIHSASAPDGHLWGWLLK